MTYRNRHKRERKHMRIATVTKIATHQADFCAKDAWYFTQRYQLPMVA